MAVLVVVSSAGREGCGAGVGLSVEAKVAAGASVEAGEGMSVRMATRGEATGEACVGVGVKMGQGVAVLASDGVVGSEHAVATKISSMAPIKGQRIMCVSSVPPRLAPRTDDA